MNTEPIRIEPVRMDDIQQDPMNRRAVAPADDIIIKDGKQCRVISGRHRLKALRAAGVRDEDIVTEEAE